jgi:hypothetical protein
VPERCYIDRLTKVYAERVLGSAQKRFNRLPRWYSTNLLPISGGKPYTLFRMGVDDETGRCTHIAFVNRAGAVYWSATSKTTEWLQVEGEPQDSAPSAPLR